MQCETYCCKLTADGLVATWLAPRTAYLSSIACARIEAGYIFLARTNNQGAHEPQAQETQKVFRRVNQQPACLRSAQKRQRAEESVFWSGAYRLMPRPLPPDPTLFHLGPVCV